jgi:hydroxymethylpyrimidine/phosphomethylpyrimidine kinase
MILIGGFDGTGGAGILADLKVSEALNIKPYFITTNIAVQNHTTGFKNFPILKEALLLSLNSIFEEKDIAFAKIGMVGSLELAEVLCEFLANKNVKIILDTPLKTSSGFKLQENNVVLTLAKHSFLTTPNKEEFEELKNLNNNILIKSYADGTDRLILNSNFVRDFSMPKLELKRDVRGTGCSLASAICCYLHLGESLENSIEKAKLLIYDGMKNATLHHKSMFLNFTKNL